MERHYGHRPKGKAFLCSEFMREAKTFKKLSRQMYSEMTIEEVHDFRVLTRKLRAPLWLVHHCNDSKKARRVGRELQNLGQRLGKMRQLDVAIGDAQKLRFDPKKLHLQRALATTGLHHQLEPERINKLVKHLGSAASCVNKTREKDVRAFLKTLEGKVTRRFGQLPKTKAGRHRLRILVKKVRYLIESFGERSDVLEHLQDHLGRERDLSNFQSIFGKTKDLHRQEAGEIAGAEQALAPALRSALKKLEIVRRELNQKTGPANAEP